LWLIKQIVKFRFGSTIVLARRESFPVIWYNQLASSSQSTVVFNITRE
jgi:hypothetical protein